MTEADIARIPRRNVRVPVTEFVRVWSEAEQLNREATARHEPDWYLGGVVVTCRWIARATVRPEDGRPWRMARSPVTGRTDLAYEELIEAEHVAADKLDMNPPARMADRPGWTSAICATLRWAWACTGPAPVAVADTSATA